jgi:hypothetical protein
MRKKLLCQYIALNQSDYTRTTLRKQVGTVNAASDLNRIAGERLTFSALVGILLFRRIRQLLEKGLHATSISHCACAVTDGSHHFYSGV